MERSRLAVYLIAASTIMLVPIFFLAGAFHLFAQIYLYVFAGITILFLLIGLIFARKDITSHHPHWGGRITARTPIMVGIALVPFGFFGYLTDGFGLYPGVFTVPPGSAVQATIMTILAIMSAIVALIGAIVYVDPRNK